MSNMKKIIPILLFCFISAGCKSPQVELQPYEEIVEAPGVSKSDLFIRAQKWMTSNCNKADSSIDITDTDNGNISGQYIILTKEQSGMNFWIPKARCGLSVDVKDGKCRMILTALEVQECQNDLFSVSKEWRAITNDDIEIIEFDKNSKKLGESFEKAITSSNDW
jgi:hypothetical protein